MCALLIEAQCLPMIQFMLLTNQSVAHIIANALPEQALLRRHEPPSERRLASFVTRASKLGFDMDPTSAGTLQKSFENVVDNDSALCIDLLRKKVIQRWVPPMTCDGCS